MAPLVPATPSANRPSRAGFTLFEVGLSLMLVSFSVVSVLMLFPQGIKAQQLSRFQVYAAAKALEMVEAYNSSHNANPAGDAEAPNEWDVHASYKNFAPDLESRVSSYRFGLFPLPTVIAQRLDSDNNEIQSVLAEGAYLYYSQPLATTGLQENGFSGVAPNEAQKLVCAVVGYPQNNAYHTLPQKAWPYYTPYPSPPIHVIHRANAGNAASWWATNSLCTTLGGYPTMLWEDVNLGGDAKMRELFQAYNAFQDGPNDATLLALAQTYANKAVEWCASRSLLASTYDGTGLLSDFAGSPDKHLQVLGARFVAHAANCLLKQVSPGSGSAGGITIDATSVKRMHENSLFLAMKFAATYPYDWGAPRPLQRAIMMDYPLLEHDLWRSLPAQPQNPLTGPIYGATGQTAEQWRPVAPFAITNVGRSLTYPDANGPAPSFGEPLVSLFGPPEHSTLTAPFAPAERCRQIVFWAVDWQSYDDFELAPSAPVDAGRYQRNAPQPDKSTGNMYGGSWWMDHHLFGYRNPEKMICFNSLMTGVASGTATPPGKAQSPGVHGIDDFGGQTNDQGLGSPHREIFSGVFGADRNGNGKFDRGNVPSSVRLRAVTVARFNYYDLRVPAVIR
jgi:type II secretory pathway pseudopilin PulG